MKRLLLLIPLFLGSAAIGPCEHEPLGSANEPDAGPPLCALDECKGKNMTLIACADGDGEVRCVRKGDECVLDLLCPPPAKDDGGTASCSGANPSHACRGSAVCIPSSCGCDKGTGTWACTEDCGLGRDCTDPNTCAPEDNPANKCGDCVPSLCGCDPTTGDWICTADCGPARRCDPGPTACEPQDCGPRPLYPCSDGTSASSTCERDSMTGQCQWNTEMCSTCKGENPADACGGPNACVPSSCSCDSTTGAWVCTEDCGGGRNCDTCPADGVCNQLAAEYANAFARAQVCDPLLRSVQCAATRNETILCGCPAYVNDVDELDALREKWEAAGCTNCGQVCPLRSCVNPGDTGACKADPVSPTSGKCQGNQQSP